MAKEKAPAQVEDDDEDFVETPKPGKTPKAPAAKAKPAEQVQEPVETPDDSPDEPVKPRFHPRLMQAAEDWGLSPDDIAGCETAQELKDLIKIETDLAYERRQKQMGTSGAGREGPRAGTAPDPEVPSSPKEEVAAIEDDFEAIFEQLKTAKGYDAELMDSLKKVGKEVAGLRKNSNPAKLEKIEKELEEARLTIQQLIASNNPVAKRAQAVVAKYTSLFGDDFDQYGNPPEGTDERERYDMLVTRVRKMHEAKKGTGIPEKDIPAAIAALWPGVKAGAAAAADDDEPPPPPRKVVPPKAKGTTRIDEWNDSGQAPATNRNGADRSGVPSEKDAVGVVAKKLKERGIDPGTIPDAEDLDDF